MMPWAAFIRIEWRARAHRNRRLNLWIPLFLVWLILLPLVLALFPVLALACLLVRINVLRLYGAAWGLLTGLAQTRVEVRTPAAKALVSIV